MVNFINYCKIELGLSQNTLNAYQKDIEDLIEFSNGQKINASIVNQWLNSLKSLSQNSRRRKLMTARTYFRYLIEVEKTHDNTELIKLNIINKNTPDIIVMSISQIEKLYNNCQCPLDISIIDLLYSIGMRATEVCLLKKNSISWGDKKIHIRGKGSRDRVVPVTNQCLANLNTYLKSRLDNTDFLLTKNGVPLSRHIINRIVKKVSNGEFSAHGLRHACATHLLEGGMSIEMIQRFLGHTDPHTTQVYTHVSTDYIRKVYNKYWSK